MYKVVSRGSVRVCEDWLYIIYLIHVVLYYFNIFFLHIDSIDFSVQMDKNLKRSLVIFDRVRMDRFFFFFAYNISF